MTQVTRGVLGIFQKIRTAENKAVPLTEVRTGPAPKNANIENTSLTFSEAGKKKAFMRNAWISDKTEYLLAGNFDITQEDGKEVLRLQNELGHLLFKIEQYAVPEDEHVRVMGFQPKGCN